MRLGRDGWEFATGYRHMLKDAAAYWQCMFLPSVDDDGLVFYSQPITDDLVPVLLNPHDATRQKALCGYALIAQTKYEAENEWPER